MLNDFTGNKMIPNSVLFSVPIDTVESRFKDYIEDITGEQGFGLKVFPPTNNIPLRVVIEELSPVSLGELSSELRISQWVITTQADTTAFLLFREVFHQSATIVEVDNNFKHASHSSAIFDCDYVNFTIPFDEYINEVHGLHFMS